MMILSINKALLFFRMAIKITTLFSLIKNAYRYGKENLLKPKLTAIESRIIGVLLEKEVTTPDAYPMTLNGLTNACNQKSSREPVMSLSESEVQNALDDLKEKHLIMTMTGQRALKYQHRFCNTEFSDQQLSPQEIAVVCLLLLRGPQTAGELRTRSQRMVNFKDVSEVEVILNTLIGKSTVKQLPREPGRRECRYQHLYSDTPEGGDHEVQTPTDTQPAKPSADSAEIADLLELIDALEQKQQALENRITVLEAQHKLQ